MMTHWHQKDEAAYFNISKLQINYKLSVVFHMKIHNSGLTKECDRPQRPDMSKSNFRRTSALKHSPLWRDIFYCSKGLKTHKKYGFCFFLNTKEYIKGNGVVSLLHINSFGTDAGTSQMFKFLSWSNSVIVVAW